MNRYLTSTCAFFLVTALASAQQAANPLRQMSSSFESLVARVSPAVVEIFVNGYGPDEDQESKPDAPISRQSSLGSGVIVDSNGYIVTNYHVIKGAQRVNVLITPASPRGSQVNAALRPEPESLPATILGFNKAADLAVLKVNATGLPTVPFGRYTHLRQGELVLAIGSPEGLQNSVSMGLVSSVLRQVDTDSPMIFIQTDAAINPGNSGGALVDVDGNLVGINSSILTESGGNEGIGFAIPSGIVRFVYQQIRQYGRVRRGDLGADVQTVTPALAAALKLSERNGVVVSDVVPDSPADAAGLKILDLIQSINDIPVRNESEFVMDMYTLPIGTRARVAVLRGTQQLTMNIPVVEMKPDAGSIADRVDPAKDAVTQLGIFGIALTPQLASVLAEPRIGVGVVVAATTGDHRADDIGLKSGDIIHSVNGASVGSVSSLQSALKRLKPGDPAALQVERDGRLTFFTFEIE